MITSIPREISDPGLITKHFQYTLSSKFNCLIQLTPLFMFDLCHKGPSFFFFLQTHVPAQSHHLHSDELLLLHSPVRPTPAVLSRMFASALMSTSWWGWTWRGTVSATDWSSILFEQSEAHVWGCCVSQAQGNERQAVFCHKGPKGGEDPDQDPSVCSDILLRHLWLWKGIVFYQHNWDQWLYSCDAQKVCYHWMALQSKSR